MRIFLNHVDQYIGKHLAADLRSIHAVENQLFGTVKDEEQPIPESIKRIVPKGESPRLLLNTLLTCSMIVFDLASADLDELILLLKVMKITKFTQKTVLVLVSSVMVWAKTKTGFENQDPDAAEPGDGDEPNEVRPTALAGDEYQRRLPSKQYARWKTAETLALSLNSKDNLQTYVVCPGLLYGCGESTLLDSMKAAWLQRQAAQVLSAADALRRTAPAHDAQRLAGGNNYVPTVHVRDLARVVSTLALGEVEQSYLLCVDMSKATQGDIVRGIVDKVGDSFKPPVVAPADFVPPLASDGECWSPDYTDFMALCDLRLEPCEVMQAPTFSWWAKDGLIENIETVASEFCRWRNLRPIRILLGGPPAAGKTRFSRELADYYGILHIQIDEVLAGGRARCAAEAAKVEAGEEGDEALLDMQQYFAEGNPLPLAHEAGLIRQWLQKNVCKYRGFVLDGYPQSSAACGELLLQKVEASEDDAAPVVAELATALCPDFCVILDPSEPVLRERVLALPQSAVDGTENTEEGFERRLARYNEDNKGPGTSVTDFFRERDRSVLEVHSEANVFEAVRLFIESEGRPWNNMPTERFLALEAFKYVEDGHQVREEQRVAAEASLEEAEEAVRKQRQVEEAKRVQLLEASEQAHLEAASKPLQQYLHQNVVPILTAGLLETCNIMPEDPVEYMAEFLFEHANDIEVWPLVV